MIDAKRKQRVHASVRGRPHDDVPPPGDDDAPPTGRRDGNGRADSKDGEQPTGRDVAKRGPEIIAEIWDRRDEPLVPIEIGGGALVATYLGSIVLLIGGTGAGKTSLALEVAIRHAVERGPAIVASLELVKRILGARVIGIRCGESWPGVLTGRVPREHMAQQWPGRLRIIERRDATIENLHASVAAMRAEFDGEPLLLVVDYVQLMDNDEREIRRRVARAMEELDEIANEHRAVVLALSQGSRVASRQLASGERMGRETADAGAEAAELEQAPGAACWSRAAGPPRRAGRAHAGRAPAKGCRADS
jgi:hypothetical protein